MAQIPNFSDTKPKPPPGLNAQRSPYAPVVNKPQIVNPTLGSPSAVGFKPAYSAPVATPKMTATPMPKPTPRITATPMPGLKPPVATNSSSDSAGQFFNPAFVSSVRQTLEGKFDDRNSTIQKAYNPGYRNFNADNTYHNALKHAGTAAEFARSMTTSDPVTSAAMPIMGGLVHEYGTLLNKYLVRDPRTWGQNPRGQNFGFMEDVRRTNMDNRNNIIGSIIGAAKLSPENQQKALMWALKNGLLKVLDGQQYPIFSNAANRRR